MEEMYLNLKTGQDLGLRNQKSERIVAGRDGRNSVGKNPVKKTLLRILQNFRVEKLVRYRKVRNFWIIQQKPTTILR